MRSSETELSVKTGSAYKINYFDTYFGANKSNMKSLWTGIKSIIKTE